MTLTETISRGLGGAASEVRRRSTTAFARVMPAHLSRRPLAMGLAIGGACLALVVVAWIALSPDERHAGTVELDLPAPQADRRSLAERAPPRLAPAGSDRLAEARGDSANALSVPAATAEAFAGIPLAPRDVALPPAPEPALSEQTDAGTLPRRGEDGRVPWQAYARPFSAPSDHPRVAVIVAGLGSSPTATSEIIRRLPGAFTLAFEPRVDGVGEMARAARLAGHGILLGLPVQDDAFPFVDRGPDALTPELPPAENRARLERLLGRFSGYVGVVSDARVAAGDAGGQDARRGGPLALAADDTAARGLLFVGTDRVGDTAASSVNGVPVPLVRLDLTIGADLAGDAIDARLEELEALAETEGYAVAIASPTPVTAERLARWASSLAEKNVALAPVSAIAAMERP